jgi:hypothetical protein
MPWNGLPCAWNDHLTAWNSLLRAWNGHPTAWNNLLRAWNGHLTAWNNLLRAWNGWISEWFAFNFFSFGLKSIFNFKHLETQIIELNKNALDLYFSHSYEIYAEQNSFFTIIPYVSMCFNRFIRLKPFFFFFKSECPESFLTKKKT